MPLKTFHCTRCDDDFQVGDWTCKDGKRHTLPVKTFYSPTASWRTYVSEERIVPTATGHQRHIPARLVEFVRGTYTTVDPEDQYGLDGDSGCITPEEWKLLFITAEERVASKERELKAKEERLAREEASLLERVKASKTQTKAVSA